MENQNIEEKTLTNKEVIAEIRKEVKPYIGKMSQPLFSSTAIKIENGLCKVKTVKDFFEKFGYFGDWDNFKKEEK